MPQLDNIILNGVTYELGSGDGVTAPLKQALLQIANNVAYEDDNGEYYYDALESALYPGDYTITNNLIGVVNSNNATSINDGDSYSANLTTIDSQKSIKTVSITMGGIDITSTAYNNGIITIANVMGDIVIAASVYLAYYDTDDENVMLVTGGNEALQSDNSQILSNTANSNTRRSVFYSSGIAAVYRGTQSSNTLSDMYPLPVPIGTTKITISCDIPTHYTSLQLFSSTGTGYSVANPLVNTGWVEGSATISLESATASVLYMLTNSKRNSSGSAYTDANPAPTRFVIACE